MSFSTRSDGVKNYLRQETSLSRGARAHLKWASAPRRSDAARRSFSSTRPGISLNLAPEVGAFAHDGGFAPFDQSDLDRSRHSKEEVLIWMAPFALSSVFCYLPLSIIAGNGGLRRRPRQGIDH